MTRITSWGRVRSRAGVDRIEKSYLSDTQIGSSRGARFSLAAQPEILVVRIGTEGECLAGPEPLGHGKRRSKLSASTRLTPHADLDLGISTIQVIHHSNDWQPLCETNNFVGTLRMEEVNHLSITENVGCLQTEQCKDLKSMTR